MRERTKQQAVSDQSQSRLRIENSAYQTSEGATPHKYKLTLTKTLNIDVSQGETNVSENRPSVDSDDTAR